MIKYSLMTQDDDGDGDEYDDDDNHTANEITLIEIMFILM